MVKIFIGAGIDQSFLFKQLHYRNARGAIYLIAIAEVEHQVKFIILFVLFGNVFYNGSVVADGNGLPFPFYIQFIECFGVFGDAL